MSELEVKDLKDGEIVYGCAFNIDFDRQNWYGGRVTHNICKPARGISFAVKTGFLYRFNTIKFSCQFLSKQGKGS